MIDWVNVRRQWRKEAERYATKRHPRKCICGGDGMDSCSWCDAVVNYMKTMEQHADVVEIRKQFTVNRWGGQQ